MLQALTRTTRHRIPEQRAALAQPGVHRPPARARRPSAGVGCLDDPGPARRLLLPAGVELSLREGGDFTVTSLDEEGNEYFAHMTVTRVQVLQQLSYGWPSGPEVTAGHVTVRMWAVGRDTLVQYRFEGQTSGPDLAVVKKLAAGSLERLAELVTGRCTA